jgi:hypothetical protein
MTRNLVAPVQAADKKPNIVFMLVDNLGYGELGVYGGVFCAVRRRRALTSLPAKACACSISTSRLSARPPVRHS